MAIGIKYEIWRKTTEDERMALVVTLEPRSNVSFEGGARELTH